MSAREASARLGVKAATLYTYVSRGLIRSVACERGRERLYIADDVERVAEKAEARRGHRAVAAGALRFGDPVLDTQITAAGPERLVYRGHDAVQLVERGTSYESIAALLWGESSETPWRWPKANLLKGQDGSVPFLWRFARLLPRLAADDRDRVRHGWSAEPERAIRVIRSFAASVGSRPGAAPKPASIAGTLASRFGLEARAEPALNAALGIVADHELNVSTFAARVAASGGADLYACIGAALYAFSGPRHGGAPQQIAGWVESIKGPRHAPAAVQASLDRGEDVPGFGHPLYPAGDPRTPPLIAWAERMADRRRPHLSTLFAVNEAMRAFGPHAMTIDMGLLALTYALGLTADDASAIFCVGRVAGWAAHVFEQRATGALLRPRARYVGEVASAVSDE